MVRKYVILKPMRRMLNLLAIVLGVIFIGSGSGSGCEFINGWKLDYGSAKVHIEESDLAERGKEFVGKKVVVRGMVKQVDFSREKNPKIILSYGTECHFGKMKAMAEAIKVGDSVMISGILVEGKDEQFFLKPAMNRDPKAPFNP